MHNVYNSATGITGGHLFAEVIAISHAVTMRLSDPITMTSRVQLSSVLWTLYCHWVCSVKPPAKTVVHALIASRRLLHQRLLSD